MFGRFVGFTVAFVVGLGACTSEQSLPKVRKANTQEETDTTAQEDAGVDRTAPPAVPARPASVEVFLSDLEFQAVSSGHGPVERNISNGEAEPNDGRTLSLGGVTYNKGLGVHAPSEIVFPLGGQYESFAADVGVDDEVGDPGSVTFQVVVDGEMLFDSGVMTGASETKKVAVSVAGKQELKLLVGDAAGGLAYDHADWANARLVKRASP